MPNPPKHPVEQPVFRSLMLTSLFLGTVSLLFCAPRTSSDALGAITLLLFALFLVSFGLYWLAWVLREHELWREGRQGQEDQGQEE